MRTAAGRGVTFLRGRSDWRRCRWRRLRGRGHVARESLSIGQEKSKTLVVLSDDVDVVRILTGEEDDSSGLGLGRPSEEATPHKWMVVGTIPTRPP